MSLFDCDYRCIRIHLGCYLALGSELRLPKALSRIVGSVVYLSNGILIHREAAQGNQWHFCCTLTATGNRVSPEHGSIQTFFKLGAYSVSETIQFLCPSASQTLMCVYTHTHAHVHTQTHTIFSLSIHTLTDTYPLIHHFRILAILTIATMNTGV